MTLSIHPYTPAGAGCRKSPEGRTKPGIWNTGHSSKALADFIKTGTLAGARVLRDNGLNIIRGAVEVTGPWEPHPNFAKDQAQVRNVVPVSKVFLTAHT